MKRDMDLVRLILFEVEKIEKWDEWKDIKIEGNLTVMKNLIKNEKSLSK